MQPRSATHALYTIDRGELHRLKDEIDGFPASIKAGIAKVKELCGTNIALLQVPKNYLQFQVRYLNVEFKKIDTKHYRLIEISESNKRFLNTRYPKLVPYICDEKPGYFKIHCNNLPFDDDRKDLWARSVTIDSERSITFSNKKQNKWRPCLDIDLMPNKLGRNLGAKPGPNSDQKLITQFFGKKRGLFHAEHEEYLKAKRPLTMNEYEEKYETDEEEGELEDVDSR